MRVYLDTCAIQRPLDNRDQLRIRLEAEAVLGVLSAIEAGALELIASDVLRFETDNNPIPARRDFSRRVVQLASRDVSSAPEPDARARDYERAGIKPLDAVHLASAVAAGADFFCTVDDGLLRKATDVNTGATRVVSPLELVRFLQP